MGCCSWFCPPVWREWTYSVCDSMAVVKERRLLTKAESAVMGRPVDVKGKT
jgi:hypothetical protein